MNITRHETREATLSWGRQVAELLRQRPDGTASEGVESAVDQFTSARFQLAVLGKAKRGKSTLINALLGRHDDVLAPIDKLPASSAITKFTWSDQEGAVVVFRDGRKEAIPFQRIREFVTEEFNRENHKEVDVVEVSGPFDGLDRDLVLVDTPGAHSIHEHHDALLHAFIPQADAVIFLVTARMPIDRDELELLAQIKAADIRKLFFAINKVDELTERDLHDAVDHNRRLLAEAGVQIQRIHEISAKRAFQGDLTGSGVLTLATDIAAFVAVNKGKVLNERFVSRVHAQAAPVLQALDVQLAGYHKSSAEIDTDLRNLRDKKRSIDSERGLAEREFNRAWTVALDQFEQAVSSAKQTVIAEIGGKIANTPMLEVSALARTLPTLLNRTIEERLSAPARCFEQAAREACNHLQTSYPSLSVDQTGAIALRTKDGLSLVAGATGGLALAAAGTGVAIAGSAAAAGIAAANAAALAATTTVAAPSVVSGLLTWIGLEALAPLAMGTATVAAPGALTATPLWVALAGPVGWTLAGVGLLAIPFSWRLSKAKLKDKLEQASQEQIALVFEHLKSERFPALRNLGKSIAEEYQIRLDRELRQIEAAMVSARDNRPCEEEIARLRSLSDGLRSLLIQSPLE